MFSSISIHGIYGENQTFEVLGIDDYPVILQMSIKGAKNCLYFKPDEAIDLLTKIVNQFDDKTVTPILLQLLNERVEIARIKAEEQHQAERAAMHRINFDTDYNKHALDGEPPIV